ncbi:MAG: T9SS type A sorting domain-containing protein [Bacteroidetes bacterium]|nr:T9SS type A sorting domain-containing protein [Bacteroidota bacterium]
MQPPQTLWNKIVNPSYESKQFALIFLFIFTILLLFKTLEAKSACITTTNVVQPLCNEGTGSATAFSSGAVPINYSWSSGQISQTVTGLSAGYYTVTVIDAVGCSSTTIVSIISPSKITVSATSTPTTCGQSNGAGTANGIGGTGKLTYSWSNGTVGINVKTVSGLAAGTYTVTVSDENKCTVTATMVVNCVTGMSEPVADANFRIYPNPATVSIAIEDITNKAYTIQLVNLLGQTMYSTYQSQTGNTVIDVSIFPKGIYMIQLKNLHNNAYISKKLIIE